MIAGRRRSRRDDHEGRRIGRADVHLGAVADRTGQAGAAQGQAGSAAEFFGKALAEGGIPAAEKKLNELQKRRANGPIFDEAAFITLGYKLAGENRLEFALDVFEKNAESLWGQVSILDIHPERHRGQVFHYFIGLKKSDRPGDLGDGS